MDYVGILIPEKQYGALEHILVPKNDSLKGLNALPSDLLH